MRISDWSSDVCSSDLLSHEEGRRLQHVYNAGDLVHRRVFVHVGEHGHAYLLLHGGQHLQAFFQARATEAGARGAVGLVEAGLEDEVDAEPGSDFLELAGDRKSTRLNSSH